MDQLSHKIFPKCTVLHLKFSGVNTPDPYCGRGRPPMLITNRRPCRQHTWYAVRRQWDIETRSLHAGLLILHRENVAVTVPCDIKLTLNIPSLPSLSAVQYWFLYSVVRNACCVLTLNATWTKDDTRTLYTACNNAQPPVLSRWNWMSSKRIRDVHFYIQYIHMQL